METDLQKQVLEMMQLVINYKEFIIPIVVAVGHMGFLTRKIYKIRHQEDVGADEKPIAIKKNKFSNN